MKYLLLTIFLLLTIASEETWRHLPNTRSAVPVISWVTDMSTARAEQIALFPKWMQKNSGPPCKMEVDAANDNDTKKIIQCVSGVGGDVIDTYGDRLAYFNAIGFLADVTTVAKKMNYDVSHTYPAVVPDICLRSADGEMRQYLFPCNVAVEMGVVNRGVLAKYHQPIPPARWTLQDFEDRGKAYVEAANPPGTHEHYFSTALTGAEISIMRRSLGVGEFDETQTHCTLNDVRYARVMELITRWRLMHIIPSKADEASFSAASGYGGPSAYLFNAGNYAIFWTGRHLIIAFRESDKARAAAGQPPLDLTVVEPPNGGFPNTVINARAAGVYRASKHFELACYFQEFLASDDYNRQIVTSGDALPPDPKWAASEEFVHPAPDPSRGIYEETEWDFHKHFAEGALQIAIGGSYSPFVLTTIVEREDNAARDLYLESGQLSAMEAAQRAAQRINAEIARSLAENPTLREQYDFLCQRQRQIDDLKAAGKKVPLAWIIDPFRRVYMQSMGMTQ